MEVYKKIEDNVYGFILSEGARKYMVEVLLSLKNLSIVQIPTSRNNSPDPIYYIDLHIDIDFSVMSELSISSSIVKIFCNKEPMSDHIICNAKGRAIYFACNPFENKNKTDDGSWKRILFTLVKFSDNGELKLVKMINNEVAYLI